MNKVFSRLSTQNRSQPFLGKILIGISATCAVLSAYKYLQAKNAEG